MIVFPEYLFNFALLARKFALPNKAIIYTRYINKIYINKIYTNKIYINKIINWQLCILKLPKRNTRYNNTYYLFHYHYYLLLKGFFPIDLFQDNFGFILSVDFPYAVCIINLLVYSRGAHSLDCWLHVARKHFTCGPRSYFNVLKNPILFYIFLFLK